MGALARAIAVVAAVLVASGCGGSRHVNSSPRAKSPGPRQIPRTTPIIDTDPVVLPISPKGMRGIAPAEGARFLSTTRLAIPAVLGSSNCPSAPRKLLVESPHAIKIDLVVGSWHRTASGRRVQMPGTPSGGICLADLHPVPLVIAINPNQIDVHGQLKVSLYYPKFATPKYKRPVVLTVPPL